MDPIKIIPKKNSVAGSIPLGTELVSGEIAINYEDKKLYGKHPTSGAVLEIGGLSPHFHDQLISEDDTADVEITNSGGLKVTDDTGSSTIIQPSFGTSENTITLPDKTGTVALLDDIEAGGGNINYSSSTPDTTLSVAVGGAPATLASTWKTKTLVEVLDLILFPTVLASISTQKSASLTWSSSNSSPTTYSEVGYKYNRVFDVSFNRGRITNGSGTQGPELVGAATEFLISGTGITSQAITSGQVFSDITAVAGANTWTLTVNHAAGTGDYFDNKGNLGTNLNSSRVAAPPGTAPTSSRTVTGIYPYYVLRSPVAFTNIQFSQAIANESASNIHASATLTKFLLPANGTLTLSYALNSEYMGVAHHSSYNQKNKYYITNLDTEATTNIFTISTLSTNGVSGSWTSQTYRYYISGLVLNPEPTIQLRES